VCGVLIGLFAGVFRTTTWAMTAIGVSAFAQLHANSAMALQIMGVVQHLVGLSVVVWITWAISVGVDAIRRGRARA
jgi:hypothetical protein